MRRAERRFAGEPGQVMFMIKDCGEGDGSRYIPIASSNEGELEGAARTAPPPTSLAHSWFRSLSGLDYASGFNAERILHEYEVALNTVILSAQEELLDPLKAIMEEALHEGVRFAGGSEPSADTEQAALYESVGGPQGGRAHYDPENELEQLFVAQITKYAMRNID